MEELKQKIQQLPGSLVGEVVKNLSISFQYQQGREVSDGEVRETLQGLKSDGESEALRQAIVSEAADADQMERWGRGLLLYLAEDEEMRPQIEEAIEDARASGVKDFGIGTLIFIGALLVALKWRPKRIVRRKDETIIEWEDNDVSAVSDLANLISGGPSS
jgi:hypothetical protein